MISTFKLLNSYFWKTYYGPILAFIFPIIFLGILGNIYRIEYVYPGIIAMSFLFIGLLSLPLSIMELKQSSLFKYIGSSPVNPLKFSLSIILFYVFISLITAIVILVTTMALFSKDVFPVTGFKNGILGGIFMSIKGVFSFYLSTFIHLIFTIAAGLLISTVAKTPQQALTTGLIILIPSIFLSGMILSVDIIAQSPILNWISRLIPFRYSTGNMIIASTPAPQIGDMFQQLDNKQMHLVFDTVLGKDGTPLTEDSNAEPFAISLRTSGVGTVSIHSMTELEDYYNKYGTGIFTKGIADQKLFELTFGAAMKLHANSADNNVFNWMDGWAVRRIPEIDSIKSFIMQYFSKFKAGSAGGTDWGQLRPFADQIAKGQFSWLEIFMKQTNLLYTRADRALNILLPLTLTIGSIWYVGKNFNWSAR